LLEAVQRCLRPEQLGPEGIKDRLRPDVQPGPVPAQPSKGPLQLGSGALGTTDGVGQQQAVVGGQQGPSTSWLSSRSRWQLLQVAMILIWCCLLGWLRR
jgi:hypothetical protein